MKRKSISIWLLLVCLLGGIIVFAIKSNFEYAETSIRYIIELNKKEEETIKVYTVPDKKAEANTYIAIIGNDAKQLSLTQDEKKAIFDAFDGQELSTYKEKNFTYDMAITVNAIAQIFIDTDTKTGYAIKRLDTGYYTGYFLLTNGQERVLENLDVV